LGNTIIENTVLKASVLLPMKKYQEVSGMAA
jgi:hypothetical protein